MELLTAQDQVITAIKNTLIEHGIDLPFPTQHILFHDQTEETDGDRLRQVVQIVAPVTRQTLNQLGVVDPAGITHHPVPRNRLPP